MHHTSEIEKLASINDAYSRREELIKEAAIRTTKKQKEVDDRESLLINIIQPDMEVVAEERLRAETARAIFQEIQNELMEDLRAREEIKQAREEKRKFLVPKVQALLLELVAARDASEDSDIAEHVETEAEKEVPPQ